LAAVGGRCIHLGPHARQDFEAHLALLEQVDDPDQMLQIPPEPIQFPDDQRIARLEGLQTAAQPRAVILPAGGQVCVDTMGIDPRRCQGIALEIEHLGAIPFGDTDVADQHTPSLPVSRKPLRPRQTLRCFLSWVFWCATAG